MSLTNPLAKEQATRIEGLFSALKADEPGYAIGVVRDGATMFTGAYGSADLEHAVPISTGSRFYMGSVSKQFAALSVLMLAAERGIELSEKIRKTFPELPPCAEEITLYHLLTHTSGLRDYYALGGLAGYDPETVYTEHLALKMLGRQEDLNFAQGAEWLYSNSGYLLLAMFVHRVSGQMLDAFARDRIFGPLGMAATRFQHDHAALVSNKAHGYQRRAGAWRTFDSMVDVVGGGGMYSNVDDMLLWLRNLGAGRVGAPEIETMRNPATLASGAAVRSYGMGFQLADFAGRPVVEHGGGLAGYRTHLLWLPADRLSVVVLGNSTAATPQPIARKVASIVLDIDDAPLVEPAAYPASQAALEARAGVYRRANDGGYFEVAMRDGRLMAAGVQLIPLGPDAFRAGPGAEAATVTFDGHSGAWGAAGGPSSNFERCDPRPITPQERDAYAGIYESAELQAAYRIVPRGEGLTIEMGDRPPIPLHATSHPDELLIGRTGLTLVLQRGPGAAITGLGISAIRAKGLTLKRV